MSVRGIVLKAEKPKSRKLSKELLNRGIEFHGHGGAFLVVGLRMGLAALKQLNARGWFDLRCLVFLKLKPPDSCVVDGIQISTGCTMGKRNIEIEEGDGIEAEFTKDSSRLRIALKQHLLDRLRAAQTDEEVKTLIAELMDAPDKGLFNLSVPN